MKIKILLCIIALASILIAPLPLSASTCTVYWEYVYVGDSYTSYTYFDGCGYETYWEAVPIYQMVPFTYCY